ncbi:MAG: Mrp/NBP35 family ATP-binding protein [Candidatus Odinarchaeota archaeon]
MEKTQPEVKPNQFQNEAVVAMLNKVKNVFAVLSGKGGVGKSTVAANLALAFGKKYPNRVGIIDSDIHGPNIPKILGLEGKTFTVVGGKATPITGPHGLKVVSMAFLLQTPDTPVIWRGPVKMGVIKQFLTDFEWGELDYMFVDLPPGTGDEPLSIMQLIPNLKGVILVTTPQEVALLDCRKAAMMVHKMNVPLAGIVENMSEFVCPSCHEVFKIFGEGGGKKLAEENNTTFLGSVPILPEICAQEDCGIHDSFEHFRRISDKLEASINK